MIKVLSAAAVTAALLASPATAQTAGIDGRMQFARVVATDVEKSAKFYEAVLGLKEVSRGVSQKTGPWVQLNFGDTVDAAKANASARVFIGTAQPGQVIDTVAHYGFYVSDTYAAVDRAMKAGGSVAEKPYEVKMADGTRVITYLKDPTGNQIEVLSIRK